VSKLQLESTTYHYAVKAPAEDDPAKWPDLKKLHSKSMVYRPDVLAFFSR
jgi:hypothetical protein